jgi:hypothetical protein
VGKALDGEGEGGIVVEVAGLGGTTTVAGILEVSFNWSTDVPSGRSMVVTISVTAGSPSKLMHEVNTARPRRAQR